MVACFCFIIAATSPVLLTLLTIVTDDAVAQVVPAWHQSAVEVAGGQIVDRLSFVEGVFSLVTSSLAHFPTCLRTPRILNSTTAMPFNQTSDALGVQCFAANQTFRSGVGFIYPLKLHRFDEGCPCELFQGTLRRLLSNTRLRSLNQSHIATLHPILEPWESSIYERFATAEQSLRNMTSTVLIKVGCATSRAASTDDVVNSGTLLKVPMPIAMDLFGWRKRGNVSIGWLPFRSLPNITEITGLDWLDHMGLFPQPLTGNALPSLDSVRSWWSRQPPCPWVNASVDFLRRIQFLHGSQDFSILVFPKGATVAPPAYQPVSPSINAQCLRSLLDDLVLDGSVKSALPNASHVVVFDMTLPSTRDGLALYSKVLNRSISNTSFATALVSRPTDSYALWLRAMFCCREQATPVNPNEDTNFCLLGGAVTSLLNTTWTQSLSERVEANTTLSLNERIAYTEAVYGDAGEYQITTMTYRLSNMTIGVRRFAVQLSVEKLSKANEVDGTKTTSVSVGISMSAVCIVFVLGLTHIVFHPLKVIGSVLRGCADINLNGIEKLTPSIITEILDIQINVDALVQHMTIFGRYMPDKSQLQDMLGLHGTKLKDFAETDESLAPLMQNKVFGAIPHSVTVNVEYRSRLKPGVQRNIDDMNKRTVFAFMYSAGDDLYKTLLEQIRTRLNERVGEPLEIRLKPLSPIRGDEDDLSSARLILVDECTIIQTAADVMNAIEKSEGTMYLLVVKISVKNYVPYILILFSIADVACLGLVIATWLGGPQTVILEPDIQRAAGAIAFSVFSKLFFNTLSSLYLQRRFVTLSHDYAQWMTTAMQEAVVTILAAAFSVINLRLLFSQTRATRFLKFNAPGSPEFHRLITKYSIVGYVFGNILPLFAMMYVAIQFPARREIRVVLGFTFCSINLIIFLNQTLFVKVLAYWKERKRKRVALMEQALKASKGEYEDSESGSDEGAADDPTLTKLHAKNLVDDKGGIYLGLAERDATILTVALYNAHLHCEFLDSVEIQLLVGKFLSLVFAEVKIANGLVLGVHAGTVTVAFNCHHLLPMHLTTAYHCFGSIERAVEDSIKCWSPDHLERPKVVGALLTDTKVIVGYAGTMEARSFQHMGITATLTRQLLQLANFYGARLVTTGAVSRALENALGSDHSARPIEVFELSRLPNNLSTATKGKELPAKSRAPETDHLVPVSQNSSSGSIRYRVYVFELVKNFSQDHISTSRAVFSLGVGTSGNSGLLSQYSNMYREDMPLHCILRWVGADVVPRHLTSLGPRLHTAELQAGGKRGKKGEGNQREDRKAAMLPDDHRQHPLIPTLFQKESFSLYFTDI
jgi:hypothetical protein